MGSKWCADDDGDVVSAAALEGEVDERATSVLARGRALRTRAISGSATRSLRPSVQNNKVSPSRRRSRWTSTSTLGSGPPRTLVRT